jgi:hypothetical protein
MNVDLDIVARVPLDGLVEAMGERVFVLHIGKRGQSTTRTSSWLRRTA